MAGEAGTLEFRGPLDSKSKIRRQALGFSASGCNQVLKDSLIWTFQVKRSRQANNTEQGRGPAQREMT